MSSDVMLNRVININRAECTLKGVKRGQSARMHPAMAFIFRAIDEESPGGGCVWAGRHSSLTDDHATMRPCDHVTSFENVVRSS